MRRSFPSGGLGWTWKLLDWLNTHTFPEESKYRDLAYAELAYSQLTAHLIRSETTRACLFATVHVPATELLMEKLEKSGLITYVGKVNMNRNLPHVPHRALHRGGRAADAKVAFRHGGTVFPHQAHHYAPVYSLVY